MARDFHNPRGAGPRSGDIILRAEAAADAPAIRSVLEASFGRTAEADLVDALRRGGALVLSAVAVAAGRVVGHAGYSPLGIERPAGTSSALALAPVAVAPEHQRRGIGSALLRWSLEECRGRGHGLVLVLGSPRYYGRFGFLPAASFGLRCPFPAPEEDFQLLELAPGAASGGPGALRYREEFAGF